MASFKMILKGYEKTTVTSKAVNQPKLDWFMAEIKNTVRVDDSIKKCFIKIYKSNRKFFEIYLPEYDIDRLSLLWINWKR